MYDPFDRKYKIKDLQRGYGAFARLCGTIIIHDNFLVNIGESFIVAYLISNEDNDSSDHSQSNSGHIPFKLELKIFPPQKLENPDVIICQNDQLELVIGRSPNCDIRIDDQLLSKM